MDKHLKRDAQVLENGRRPVELSQPAVDQRSAGMTMKDDEGANEECSMGGRVIGSQSAIIPENWFGSILKYK